MITHDFNDTVCHGRKSVSLLYLGSRSMLRHTHSFETHLSASKLARLAFKAEMLAFESGFL
jgi:hypothetical protein